MNSYEICKKRWRETIVGTPEALENGDGAVKARIKGCSDTAKRYWGELRSRIKTEGHVGLFRDTPAVESIEMSREYSALRTLTLGYATYGTELYGDSELLSDILYALEWGYTHYYGRAELEGRGWRSTREFNWHDWKIATPKPLMDILVMLDEKVPLEKRRDYLELFNALVVKPTDYGANKVNFGRLIAQSGILTERAERIICGRDGIEDTYMYADGGVNDGQGFYRDGSYVFHTRHAQNGVYGIEHLMNAVQFANILDGTEFAMNSERKELLYGWLRRSFIPFYRNSELMRVIKGRYPEVTTSFGLLDAILSLYEMGDREQKRETAALLRYAVEQHPLFENGECAAFFGSLTLRKYLLYREAMAEKTEAAPIPMGVKVFNQMDRVVEHGERYAFALAMSSSRIYNYECINHRNMDGWYRGDGMLYCYCDPMQYDGKYFEKADPYRMPGSTADNRERQRVSIAQANEYLSSQDFVGGLSAGDIGLAAMQLESYHSDGKLISTRFYNPSGAYGSAPPAHESTLTAKKAYFFIGGCAVCLGADINSRDGAPVYTVIDNRHAAAQISGGRITGYGELRAFINGEETALSSEDTARTDARTVTVGGEISYLILDGGAIKVRRTESEPPFVEILADHGVNPKCASYAYAVLPNTDAAEAERRYADRGFEILENSERIQAVRLSGGATLCVFWEKGEIGGITASEPVLLCVNGGKRFVCDVTRRLSSVKVTLDGREYEVDLSGSDGARVEF